MSGKNSNRVALFNILSAVVLLILGVGIAAVLGYFTAPKLGDPPTQIEQMLFYIYVVLPVFASGVISVIGIQISGLLELSNKSQSLENSLEERFDGLSKSLLGLIKTSETPEMVAAKRAIAGFWLDLAFDANNKPLMPATLQIFVKNGEVIVDAKLINAKSDVSQFGKTSFKSRMSRLDGNVLTFSYSRHDTPPLNSYGICYYAFEGRRSKNRFRGEFIDFEKPKPTTVVGVRIEEDKFNKIRGGLASEYEISEWLEDAKRAGR